VHAPLRLLSRGDARGGGRRRYSMAIRIRRPTRHPLDGPRYVGALFWALDAEDRARDPEERRSSTLLEASLIEGILNHLGFAFAILTGSVPLAGTRRPGKY